MNSKFQAMVETVQEAKRIVFLTGAGVSTESGIPDFESLNDNWPYEASREEVFSRSYWRTNPEEFWAIYKATFAWSNVVANDFHRLPKRLAAAGRYVHVLTQNVDGLHGEADTFAGAESLTLEVDNAEVVDTRGVKLLNDYGQIDVFEAHGNASHAICINGYCENEPARYRELATQAFKSLLPTCPNCSHVLKPDISLFGEGVQGYRETIDAIVNCDVLIVAGTSLKVGPVNELPHYIGYENGSLWADGVPGDVSKDLLKKSIWVNRTSPPKDYAFDYSFEGNVTDFAKLFD